MTSRDRIGTPAEPGRHIPRKRFGQNFLHDRHVIEQIVAAIDPRPGQHIVEIGPGQGALTFDLLARAQRLSVIELDRDLAAALESRGEASLDIHRGDALAFDFTELAAGDRLRVVGNLPYNISTPLLFHLFSHAGVIDDMHFMLQKEVVDRMVAPPGTKTYGRLSVMVAVHCKVERLLRVGRGAFTPAPKVESAVVRLSPHEAPPVDRGTMEMFERVLAQAFSMRRKTIRNSLAPMLDEAAIRAAGIDPGARPETLDIEAFATLSRAANRQE